MPQGRLPREVYYQVPGAFTLTRFKSVTRKVLEFKDQQFQPRIAEVFEVTLTGKEKTDPEITVRFGHQIERGDHTIQDGFPLLATATQSDHVLYIKASQNDPDEKAYRVHLHTSRKGNEAPEPRP
jgi:hypothetical protein